MKTQFLLPAALLVAIAAAPGNASVLVLYENDFNTRTSLGPKLCVGRAGTLGVDAATVGWPECGKLSAKEALSGI